MSQVKVEDADEDKKKVKSGLWKVETIGLKSSR